MHTHARAHTHAHTCARTHTNRWGSLIFYIHTHTLTHTPPPNSPPPNTHKQVGIIDILMLYTRRKKLERMWKSATGLGFGV